MIWRSGRRAASHRCRCDYHGYTLCKAGPWSQAPVALQQLALLKGFDLAGHSATDPAFVHVVAECAKLAFADREAFYGDPNFVEVPTATLLSDAYNDRRRSLIGEDASRELRPGRIAGYGADVPLRSWSNAPDLAHAGAHGGIGEPTVRRDQPDAAGRGRHLPCGRDRSPRQHGRGDAVWRLAAELAGRFRSSASASVRAPRCSGWTRATRTRSPRASGPGPRCHLRSRCGTGRPTWCSARPAATSRTSGRCTCSCATCTAA